MAIKDFYIGNTLKYNLTFIRESDASAINIAGWQIFLSFKYELDDADSAAIIQKVFTMPNNSDTQSGIANIVLSSTDTDNFTEAGIYYYGIKRVIPGSPPDVYTLETGKVKVKQPASEIVVEHAFIPDVTNVTLADAQTTLTDVGFIIGTITNTASTVITSGSVILTSPVVGSYEPLGSIIDIEVAI